MHIYEKSEVDYAIEWAAMLPDLGDAHRSKALAAEVKRLRTEVQQLRDDKLDTRRSVMASVWAIAREVRK